MEDDMKAAGVLIFHLFAACMLETEAAYSYTLENNLRTSYLGSTYNVFVRPFATVNITIALNVITLNKLSISDQSMSIAGYLTMEWNDQRLDWSSDSTYNTDIPAIYSNEDYVWRPAIIVENSVSDISVVSDDTVLMRIQKTGDITWTPLGIYKTHCETVVTFYPFDTQECDIVLTTWGYTSVELSLYIDTEAVRLSYFKENGEWSYQGFSTSSTTGTREGSSTPELTFTLKFRRRPYFHILNSLIPMMLLAFLSAMVFKLPPDSGEKMGYSLTVLLAYAVYLTIISDDMPSTSTSTSVLSVYLLVVLALGVISVLITICVLECHHKEDDQPVPNWLTKISLKVCAKFICWKNHRCLCGRKVKPFIVEKSSDTKVNDKNDKPTWKDICHILDAFFMRIYLILIGSLTCMLWITLIAGYYTA